MFGLSGQSPEHFLSFPRPNPHKRSREMLFALAVFAFVTQPAFAAPFAVDLTSFTSGIGARFVGSEESYSGDDVAIIGDHNGDGFIDYIMGSAFLERAVIVMKKDTMYTAMDVDSIVSNQYFRVIKGSGVSRTGRVAGGIGDINNDGFDDVIVGAGDGQVAGRSDFVGYAFVIFGMVGPFTDVLVTATWPASSVGFMILGPHYSGSFARYTRTARGLGDVNGDGIDDFAVAAYSYTYSGRLQAGIYYVIFGKTSSNFDTIDLLPTNFGSNGVYFYGGTGQYVGLTVMPAGDFNKDGFTDFLIPSHGYGLSGETNNGAAYLIYGSATALVTTDLSTFVTGSTGVRFVGPAGSYLGISLGGVGDVNGDGIDDIAIGASQFAPLGRAGAGMIYVIFGTTVSYTADVNLLSFAPSTLGFAIYGHAANVQLGRVVPAGDANGDGVNDILVAGTGTNSRAHIIYGQVAARTAHVDTATDNVISFFYNSRGELGSSLDGGKDLNGDSIVDILLGAPYASVTPEGGGFETYSAGAVWMIPGPFIFPSDPPSATPTTPPSANPSANPSMVPSATPSAAPSAVPSADPSANPSQVPSVTPSAAPSAVPSADPSANPSQIPSATPSVNPSAAPRAEPSANPFQAPSVNPSAAPSAGPSASPSANPSMVPSATPSVAPSTVPSADPSVNPSQVPSATPSAVPSEEPSVSPSAIPSAVPSAAPSVSPTVQPSTRPSVAPSVVPSVVPSGIPTIRPSASPSVSPSSAPTLAPTAAPTVAPTAAPTVFPSARPTVAAVKDFKLVVNVEQDVFFVNKTAYDAQQVAYNRTIQHTVADAVPGVIPERVTDIIVEEEEEEEGGKVRPYSDKAVSAVHLKYKITVTDSAFTVNKVRASLLQAAQEGKMDARLRHYAAKFGATGLNNGTFALPQITSAAVQRDASSELTGVQTALLVIGVVMFFVFASFMVRRFLFRVQSQPSLTVTNRGLDMVL